MLNLQSNWLNLNLEGKSHSGLSYRAQLSMGTVLQSFNKSQC